jgi:hypothetical protein
MAAPQEAADKRFGTPNAKAMIAPEAEAVNTFDRITGSHRTW